MKILLKNSLLVSSFTLLTFVSAQDISELPNYQIELKSNKTQPITLSKQDSRIQPSFVVNKQDKNLGVAPFEWMVQDATSKSVTASALGVANSYVQKKYPQLIAVSDGELEKTTQISGKRNIAKLRYISEMKNGVKIAKYTQEIDGIPVHAREFNVLLNASNQVVASSGFLAEQLPEQIKASSFNINQRAAIEYAFSDVMGSGASISLRDKTPNESINKTFEAQQEVSSISLDKNIRVKQIWFDQRQKLMPAYYVELLGNNNNSKQQFAYAHVISAESGDMLSRLNLVTQEAFTYRIFSENRADAKPLDGPQGHEFPIIANTPQQAFNNSNRQTAISDYINVTLESAPFSRNDPWLPASATRTEGNNVFAYLDIDSTNGFSAGDIVAETTAPFTFDYAFDEDALANDAVRKSAVVNLFYMNNWLHDWFYDSGFDEAAGNAQADNLGRGGRGGDVLLAEGQDSSGRNNANMATPSDGGSPRMQMFLFDGRAQQGVTHDLNLTNVPNFANPRIALASFGPQTFASLSNELVAFTDATAAPSLTDACEVASNATELAGKIALVDRGDCNFTVKVINAQNAGAVAVLVANNRDGDVVSTMGGSDAAVTIPSVMVSQNAGAAIRQALTAGTTINATLFREAVADIDGTFDNGIVAHEWGHYISNRLIGNSAGLNNIQGRGMGEGWGDFLTILTFLDEADAAIPGNEQFQGLYPQYGWVDNNPYFGIRRVPYTTNFELNALSFRHIEDGAALPNTHPINAFGPNTEVHNTGELWTTLLLEIYVGLINDNRYSFQQAQDLMKEYIVAGMKMTPVSPTFTEARDAILSVLRASNEQDFRMALAVFAKRGLGTGAISPDRNSSSSSGVVESFADSLLAFSTGDFDLEINRASVCSDDNILDAGEQAVVSVQVINTGFDPLTNLQLNLSTTSDVTIQNNGAATIDALAVNESIELLFTVTLNSASVAEEITFVVDFPDVADVVEPQAANLNVQVNFSFAPDENRFIEDHESTVLVENDWGFSINPNNTANVQAAQAAIRVVENARLNTTQTLFIQDVPFQADISFVSPSLSIGSQPFSISFDHLYDFEDGSWDGGVIEISQDGAVWTDIVEAGGTLSTGYSGTITTNPASPINGRQAFVNNSNGLRSEIISLGTLFANRNVQIRFRMGADANTGGFGWEIDNLNFTGLASAPFSRIVAETQTCSANTAPVAEVESSALTVTEGQTVSLNASASSDPDTDNLTYAWVQTSGMAVTLSNANSSIASFTAPQVSATTNLAFEVTVSDGSLESTAQVSVTVQNQTVVTPPAPEPPTSSGGGGSIAYVFLLLFGLLHFRRRREII